MLEMLRGHDVSVLTMYRFRVDNSLQLVGQVGLPADLVRSWWHIPPGTDVPYMRCIAANQTLFFESRQSWVDEFPTLADARSAGEAVVTVPILDNGAAIGVVGLIWRTHQEFDDVRRRAITRTVARVGPVLLRNVSESDPQMQWLSSMLQLQLDPWMVLEPVIGEGPVSDFVVQDCATSREWIGHRLLELWPVLAGSPQLDALRGLLQVGGPWSSDVNEATPAPWGIPGSHMRAMRLGQRLVVVWRLPQGNLD
jgi:hypothetical protein